VDYLGMQIKYSRQINSFLAKITLLSCMLLIIQQPQLLRAAGKILSINTVGTDPTKPSANYAQLKSNENLTQNNALYPEPYKKHSQLSKLLRHKRQTTIFWAKSKHPTTDKLSRKSNSRIWNRLRNNFCLNLARDNAQVKFHAAKLQRQNKYLQKVSASARPYISHIVEQLEERNMPGELALLPMIESSYNPNAKSCMGATGLWQFAASTGRRYGLRQSGWQDPRKDVTAATNAALNYLQFLHTEFDGDWFLALAAYNAGEGRVRRAIKRNLAQNKPTDFWSLHLPKETKNYVPKLLALASLVKHADMEEIHLAMLELNLGPAPKRPIKI